MRRRLALALAALLLTVVVAGGAAGTAQAQDDGRELPNQDIIPGPGAGEAPEEGGDRGGSLQLGILGLVVVAIVGGAAYVTHQSRRARGYSATSARIASQADTPSRNPER